MRILKIVLDNIRSHSHYEFIPALEGTTAISGTNGAGKSTIVNSFAWSLFGSKAQSLKAKDFIREGVNPKETHVGVESYFALGNREYKVDRKIVSPNGNSTCSIYSRPLNSEEDYVLDCGPGVTHSEKFLRRLLGYDEKGFYSSAFVQQKQVDLIISAGPRERGAIIEQMIGVNTITASLDMAREEFRGLQKALSVIQTGSIEDEELKFQNQKNVVVNIRNNIKDINKEIDELKEEVDLINIQFKDEVAKQEKYNNLHQEIMIIENNSKHISEKIDLFLDIVKKYPDNLTYSEELLKELTENKNEEEKKYKKSLENLLSVKLELEKLDNLFKNKINPSILTDYNNLIEKQNEIKSEISNIEFEINYIKNQGKKIQSFLKTLKEGVAECPYCKSPIENIDEELESHTLEFNNLKDDLNEKTNKLNQLKSESTITLNSIVNLQNDIDKLNQQEKKRDEYSNLKTELIKLETAEQTNKTSLNLIINRLNDLNEIKNRAEDLINARNSIKYLTERLEEIAQEKLNKQIELSLIGALTPKEYKELTKRHEDLNNKFNKLQYDKFELDKNLVVAESEGKILYANWKNCLKAAEDYNNLSKQLELINYSMKTLSEFKDLRIKTAIPSLSSIASEILNKFTNGDFIELKLNEQFEASVVTSTGKERSVSVLSGGELSAAAIALRLAIALFLQDGTQSLLILDEVLVSMSEDRQQQILETISSLSSSQIILIAHSQVANSFADKVIDL